MLIKKKSLLNIGKAREFQKSIYFCFIDYTRAFDYVDQNKLWKILKKMRIPDHLSCLLRNLYAGQCGRPGFNPWVGKVAQWIPIQVFFPGAFHGQRTLMSYSPWGCPRVRHDWVTNKKKNYLRDTSLILARTLIHYLILFYNKWLHFSWYIETL